MSPVPPCAPLWPLCPTMSLVSNCVPCVPYVPCVSLCSLCLPVSPCVPCVSLCPLCLPVSPCVPFIPCFPLRPLCPLCPLCTHVARGFTFCAGGSWGAGSNPGVFSSFFFHRIFTLRLVSVYFLSDPFLLREIFCDNVCLVVGPCTSKTRKNIYLNCLPVFSKDIYSNNCFVKFRISWLHQLII